MIVKKLGVASVDSAVATELSGLGAVVRASWVFPCRAVDGAVEPRAISAKFAAPAREGPWAVAQRPFENGVQFINPALERGL